jgi:hypothetical protein
MQKEAVAFLNKQVFETPTWMLDNKILDKISSPTSNIVSSIQDNTLGSVLSSARLSRMVTSASRFQNSYNIDELFIDLKKGIWSELATKKSIDAYRRNLQKSYVERMTGMLVSAGSGVSISMGGAISMGPDSKKNDINSVVRAHLTALRNEINAATPAITDNMSKYHLQDVSDRIKRALDPK